MTIEDDFNAFWRAYPRRISKGTARAAFAKASRKTTLAAMLTAIEDYIRFKPDRIDFKHPATWLNGECWSDEWACVPQETGRKRNFADVARDKFNGTESVFGGRRDVELVSTGLGQSGSPDGHLRSGFSGHVIRSRH